MRGPKSGLNSKDNKKISPLSGIEQEFFGHSKSSPISISCANANHRDL